jgi:hypothetical protein
MRLVCAAYTPRNRRTVQLRVVDYIKNVSLPSCGVNTVQNHVKIRDVNLVDLPPGGGGGGGGPRPV